MAVPFRVSVMQLTMEPVPEILEHARRLDEHGFDAIWLAEAYPWWRKHGMEARSATALSPLIAEHTSRLAVGWGIISPYTRHPVEVAMDARVMQEMTAGSERPRFLLGYGASKIFMNHASIGTGESRARPYTVTKDAIQIVRGVLEGGPLDYDGRELSGHVPALAAEAESPRGAVPIYVAGTGPRMQELAGELGDGLLTASITTPAFVEYSKENMRRGAEKAGRDVEALDLGCTIVASIDADDSERGRQGAREIAGMYLANKVQNIKGSADVLLEKAGLEMEEIEPVAEAMERGGRIAAAEAVTDSVLDKCKPIAGTPSECIEAIEEYRSAGCTHIMLELWGEDRNRQIELFGKHVLPAVGAGVGA